MGDDLNIAELSNIANSINKNTIENRKRKKEDRLVTDKFIIMKFKISRKKFSKLIKDTPIKYNPKSHMYDVPINDDKLSVNNNKLSSFNNNFSASNDDNLSKINTENIKNIIEKEYPEILDIINLYKKNKVNFIEKENKKIDIHRHELQGELFSKSFKTYKKVLDDFVEFCSKRVEKQRDLIAIALLEFMEKYS